MKAPGFVRRRLARRRFSGQKFTEVTKLGASVTIAVAVTAGMIGVDALTRDEIPTPSQTEPVEVEVRSTTFIPAATVSARRRQRARFAVGLRVTNLTDRRLLLGGLGLLVGSDGVSPDPNAAAVAGTLLAPVKARGVAQGELRYETAGAITEGLIAGRPLRLRLAGRSIPLKSPKVSGPAVEVDVRSATLVLAATPSGRRRQRARVAVRLRVTNAGDRRAPAGNPQLVVEAAGVRPDPNAEALAGTLLAPLEPRGVAQGELRFETAGAVTRSLVAGRPVRLRISDQTVALGRLSVKRSAPAG